jgi:hypothetical protein
MVRWYFFLIFLGPLQVDDFDDEDEEEEDYDSEEERRKKRGGAEAQGGSCIPQCYATLALKCFSSLTVDSASKVAGVCLDCDRHHNVAGCRV